MKRQKEKSKTFKKIAEILGKEAIFKSQRGYLAKEFLKLYEKEKEGSIEIKRIVLS